MPINPKYIMKQWNNILCTTAFTIIDSQMNLNMIMVMNKNIKQTQCLAQERKHIPKKLKIKNNSG